MWQFNETDYSPASQVVSPPVVSRGPGTAMLLRMLDEIDYGMLVLDGQGRIQHSNHLARHELSSARILMIRGNLLLGITCEHSAQIQQGLEHACRGQRKLVLLEHNGIELSLAFIPLSHPLEGDAPTVMVLLQRQSTCDNLAVRMFARTKGLSPSEESVMIGLCRGLGVPEIAKEHGVAESTVRSQVKSLREKTGCSSIRRLMQRITSLPPVVPALRIIAPVSHTAGEFVHP